MAARTETPARVVFVASEGVPFSKTGGMADVVGALPKVLAAKRHEVLGDLSIFNPAQTANPYLLQTGGP